MKRALLFLSGVLLLAACTYSPIDPVSNELDRVRDGSTGSFSGTGEVRITCGTVGYGEIDPIVFPGVTGRSHDHTFFGNAGIDQNSTRASLLNDSRGTTCAGGGGVNKSGYWFPTLLDDADGRVQPTINFVYYKTGYWGQDAESIQPVPQGLKMISTRHPQFAQSTNWSCGRYEGVRLPKSCNGDLRLSILFPQCWDGVHLDSANHRSHMAHPNFQGACPSTHPELLPQITMNVVWEGLGNLAGYRLSSDDQRGTAPGSSAHGDFFEAWQPEFMTLLVENCLHRRFDCGTRSFGDGFSLLDPT